MKLLPRLIILLSVIALWSCKEKNAEPEPLITPKPPITAVRASPAYGQIGALVTITGTNFGSAKSLVKVVFGNDKEAIVESVSPTEIKAIAPAASTTGAITITIEDQSVQTPVFTFYSIYTFGALGVGGGNNYRAAYWRDGTPTTISTSLSEINDMVVIGSDIYAVGYEYSAPGTSFYPVYWKNGIAVTTTGATAGTTFTGVAVSGPDVYICGYQQKNSLGGIAKYWKNGQDFVLDVSEIATATDIQIYGGDVYISGNVSSKALYWKNGSLNLLPGGTEASVLSVVGTDVYVAGTQLGISGGSAKFWKNSVATTLSQPDNDHDKSEYETAYSMHVFNGEVFVGGGVLITNSFGGRRYVPKYWKNGTAVSLREESNANLYVRCISVFQDDLIITVSGNVFNASSYVYRNSDLIMSSPGIDIRMTGHQVVTY